ncbi:MAG: hypothetical protein ACI9IL_000274 [Rickettsiales bacterium]|jgi:hypothetical protein
MLIRTIALKVFSMSNNQTIVAVSEEGEGRFYLEGQEVSDVLDLSVELFSKLKANAPIQLLIQGTNDILDLDMTLETLFAGGVQEMNLQYVARGDKGYYIDNMPKYAGKKKNLCNLYSEESSETLLVNMTDDQKHLHSGGILRRFPDLLRYISEGTKNNNQFLVRLLNCGDDDNTFLSLVTILTKELMSVHHPENMRACLDPVKRKLLLYQKLPEDIKNHEIFCLELVKEEIKFFSQLPKNFKESINFCSFVAVANQEVFDKLSLKMSIDVLKSIPEDIRGNATFCLAVVLENPELFESLPENIKNNKEFCLAVVLEKPELFESLPEDIKNDKEFCLLAILDNPELFESIPEDISGNATFCLAVVLENPELFKSLPRNIKNNKEFCLAVVSEKPELFKSLPEDIKNDTFVCARAANLNDATTKHMSDIMRNTPEIKEILQRSATPSDNPGSVTIHPAGIIFGGNDR